MSPAQLAMIFHFDKQYSVESGSRQFAGCEPSRRGALRLAAAHRGTLRLTDVKPYDIRDGKVLGLLDVIQMKPTPRATMQAQEQARSS